MAILFIFLQIIERLCALSFNANELLMLKFLIQELSEKYMELFPGKSFKPKINFLKHYPEMIKLVAPLVETVCCEIKPVRDCAKL